MYHIVYNQFIRDELEAENKEAYTAIVPIDFEKSEIAMGVFYGGDAGAKEAVVYNDAIWLLKFPKATRGYANPQISYTTSPLSEYLGSKIYESLDIPVHETMLGVRKNKIIVACKDFTRKQETRSSQVSRGFHGLRQKRHLVPFHDLKNSFMSNDLDSYSGSGSETLLAEVLATIEGQDILKSIHGVADRFWDMFVVDAFIGNNDRNNGNWGILIDPDNNEASLAPVYDNGNAFFNKRSIEQMSKRLNSDEAMRNDAYLTPVCAFKYTGLDNEGHMINPFNFMKQDENVDCKAAVNRFVNRIKMEKIERLIEEIPESFGCLSVMPKVQKDFYIKLMRMRLEYINECL